MYGIIPTSRKPHYENVPFEIPESWKWVTLGDISNYGQTKHTDVLKIPEEDWVLELEDIEKDSGRLIQALSRKDRKISGVRCEIECGQILYSKLRTYLNKVLIAPKKGFCTTEIIPFYCFGEINHYYITSVLRSQYFIDYTTLCCYGCKMPRLSTDDARKGMIPLPPIAEQKRIVLTIKHLFLLIDSIDASKNDLQEAVDRCKTKVLDLAIHGKLVSQDPNDEPAVELLKRINPNAPICDTSHYGNIPENWAITTMSNLCKIIDGEKQSNIKRIYLDVKYLRGKSDGEYMMIGKYVPANSTMILVDGENSGEIFTTTIDGYQGSTFKILDISKEMYKPFVLYIIMSYQKQLRENKVGSAIPHLNKKLFKEIVVEVPPYEEQKRIVSKIDELFSYLITIKADL